MGNEVGKIVGMTLMPSMPKFIPGHFCMIFNKKSDLDRGCSLIKGFRLSSIEAFKYVDRGPENRDLSLLQQNQCFSVSSRGVNPAIYGTQLSEVNTDKFTT